MATDETLKKTTHCRSLKDLAAGESAIINGIQLSADDYTRLASMGLCPGRSVEVLQVGARMIVRSGSTRMGLDEKLAAAIRVAG
jgi:Fe2+ transport system protein FeoA